MNALLKNFKFQVRVHADPPALTKREPGKAGPDSPPGAQSPPWTQSSERSRKRPRAAPLRHRKNLDKGRDSFFVSVARVVGVVVALVDFGIGGVEDDAEIFLGVDGTYGLAQQIALGAIGAHDH